MSRTRILILGGTGMLGHKLVQRLGETFDTFCTIRGDFTTVEAFDIFDRERVFEKINIDDFASIRNLIVELQPAVVINAVGIIKQLPTSGDVIRTLSANSIFPHLLADLARDLGFRFITVGTDCVFLGTRGRYHELEIPDALDLYGRSKQFGEVIGPNCLTLRTSIVGRELRTAHSLVDWFLSQSGKVGGYTAAIFSGFPTIVFADILADIIADYPTLSGLFHVSSDPITKFDLLSLIKERTSFEIEIEANPEVSIDRSLDSTKFREATGFSPLPWAEMVDRMFSDPTPYDEWRKPASI